MKTFKELYQYREFLFTNVKKDIRGKYKASFLGVLWSFINPLLQVVVYAIVFPYLMRVQTPNYLVFLICGIIPWTWFANSLSAGSTVITANSNLIKKVYFPREILPISMVTSGMVNFLISCIIIVLFAVFSGLGISWHIVFLPIIVILQYMLALGFAFILSAINVYIKDVEYMVGFLLNLLFYGTPILYTIDMFANTPIIHLLKLNPMTYLIESYRNIFYAHEIPGIKTMGILFLICIVFVYISYKIFKLLEKKFAEEV